MAHLPWARKLLVGRHSGSSLTAHMENCSYYMYIICLYRAFMYLYGLIYVLQYPLAVGEEAVGGEALRLVPHGPQGDVIGA
jgi:hypothetical protein